MFENFAQTAENVIHSNPWLAFMAVFAGGLLTASNPCVLAMIPLMIGFVGGNRDVVGVKRALIFSGMFVFGLSLMFTLLGLLAATTGHLLGDVGVFWKYVVAAVCFIMGIHLLEIIKIPIPSLNIGSPKLRGFAGAFVMGLLFGLVSTPCAVPILAVILVLIASGGNMLYGVGLLFCYALGHCALILIVGVSIGAAKGLIESKSFQRVNFWFRKLAAVLIILVGVYFLIK